MVHLRLLSRIEAEEIGMNWRLTPWSRTSRPCVTLDGSGRISLAGGYEWPNNGLGSAACIECNAGLSARDRQRYESPRNTTALVLRLRLSKDQRSVGSDARARQGFHNICVMGPSWCSTVSWLTTLMFDLFPWMPASQKLAEQKARMAGQATLMPRIRGQRDSCQRS